MTWASVEPSRMQYTQTGIQKIPKRSKDPKDTGEWNYTGYEATKPSSLMTNLKQWMVTEGPTVLEG